MLYQQGDVLIEAVEAIPSNALPRASRNGRHVLAEGEATGHAHAVVEDVQLFESGGALYCRAAVPFTMRHEEHKPITVPAGVYQVRRVRMYDPFSDEAMAVRD